MWQVDKHLGSKIRLIISKRFEFRYSWIWWFVHDLSCFRSVSRIAGTEKCVMQSDGRWTIPTWASAGSSLAHLLWLLVSSSISIMCKGFMVKGLWVFDTVPAMQHNLQKNWFQGVSRLPTCGLTMCRALRENVAVSALLEGVSAQGIGRTAITKHQNRSGSVSPIYQFSISHFRFSLPTLSHTESSHLPLFKKMNIYNIYIYI